MKTKGSFKKGHIVSKETRNKISLAIKKKWKNKGFRENQLEKSKTKNIGRVCSEKTREKISNSNKGRKWSKEQRNAVKGNNHHNWKGDKVGYNALHSWVKRRLKKPIVCDKCERESKYIDLANISGKYKRDLNDWIWLCRSCHVKSDDRINILRKANEKRREDYLMKQEKEQGNQMGVGS